jgi:hypothetical protein
MITNSGSQHFNVYASPFTKNDQFTASPFTDSCLFIANVTASVANSVLPALNHVGANQHCGALAECKVDLYAHGYVDSRYMEWLQDMDK